MNEWERMKREVREPRKDDESGGGEEGGQGRDEVGR